MLCQKCNKKQASVYYNKIVNGEETEMFLCNQCAKDFPEISFDFESPFSIKDIFSSFGFQAKKEIENKLICPKCKSTYNEFKKSGKFGCSQCYETFSSQVKPMIQSLQGYTEHTGKAPKRSFNKINIRNEINILKEKLNIAINNEEFELAAELRDKIKSLKSSID